MKNYIKDIVFASISTSSRSGNMDGTNYQKGDYISIFEGKILISESDLLESFNKTIKSMDPNKDSYLTIYWGKIGDSDSIEQKLISKIIELVNLTAIFIRELYGSLKNKICNAQIEPIKSTKYEPMPITVNKKSEIFAPKGPPKF